MKTISLAALGVSLTVAVAFLVARASDTNLPPSNHTAGSGNVPYKSNAERIISDPASNSRFQVISGNSWLSGDSGAANVPVMVKLDTQTGKAWLLVMIANTNGCTMSFAEIGESHLRQ